MASPNPPNIRLTYGRHDNLSIAELQDIESGHLDLDRLGVRAPLNASIYGDHSATRYKPVTR